MLKLKSLLYIQQKSCLFILICFKKDRILYLFVIKLHLNDNKLTKISYVRE